MRKQLFVAAIVIGVLALAGASSPAYAQDGVSKVTVPFQFVAGNTVLPAGPYVITAVVNHPDMLAIRSVDGKSGTTAFAQVKGSISRPSQVVFSFEKIGSRYFLSEISIPGCEDRVILQAKQRVAAAAARLDAITARPTL